jgi:hypothetical protein
MGEAKAPYGRARHIPRPSEGPCAQTVLLLLGHLRRNGAARPEGLKLKAP